MMNWMTRARWTLVGIVVSVVASLAVLAQQPVTVLNGSATDTDDGTITAGQAAIALVLGLPLEFDATSWVRVRGPHTVAHDAADAGNPEKLGFKATSSVSGQTPVANNDRSDWYGGLDGVPILRLHSNLEDIVRGVVGVTDGSSTSLVAAQGSGVKYCATAFTVSNSSATNVTVDIRDGTAGSVIWTFPAAKDMGGDNLPLSQPLCTSANTAMAQDPSAAASTVTVSTIGFKTKL